MRLNVLVRGLEAILTFFPFNTSIQNLQTTTIQNLNINCARVWGCGDVRVYMGIEEG